MSAGYLGKRTNWADDGLGAAQNADRLSQWGEIDGRIKSFDPVRQTATIQPLYKPVFNGKPVDMPELLEVPVRFPRTGKGTITYPVAPGDRVSLRPKMRSGENYHTGGDGTPSDARSFSLADMEAHLDGGEPLSDPIPGFDPQNTHIRANSSGTYGMKLSPDGKVKIQGSEGDIIDLLSQVVDLLASDALQINYGSSAGSGHQLQHKDAYAEIAAKLAAMKLV